MGVLMACLPIVAHRAGAGEADERVGGFVREALVLAVVLGVLWVIAAHVMAGPVLTRLGLDPATARIAVDFLRAYSWSGLGMSLWFVLRFTAEGVGVTTPTFYSGLLGLASNAVLDWVFMYGHLAFRRWAPWAAAGRRRSRRCSWRSRWPSSSVGMRRCVRSTFFVAIHRRSAKPCAKS